MRNVFAFAVAAVLVVSAAPDVFAQNPSSKFAAQVSNVTLVPDTTSMNWTTVLTASLKTPNKKDLLIGGSLETALYTLTQVKGKNGATDTASASATLEVRMLVDGAVAAYPEGAVYDERLQQLSATLGGVIESCTDGNGDGTIVVKDECIVTDEMIELILDTMGARHFNFVVANLSPGSHTVELQVRVGTNTNYGNGTASATAGVGRGSLTIEEVRGSNSPDGISFILD